MRINLNTNNCIQPKNLSFGAFTKKSEIVIFKDVIKYGDEQLLKDTEELIQKENQRNDRTIKVSPYRVVEHNYVPVGFRTVTVVNNLTRDKRKIDICCDLPDCYKRLIDSVNI